MVRVTLQMKVQPGRAAEFEQAWRAVAEQAKLEPENLRQALLRDANDPDTFFVTSDWQSREAFGRFERSPEQDILTARLRELRQSATMTVLDVVAYVEGGVIA